MNILQALVCYNNRVKDKKKRQLFHNVCDKLLFTLCHFGRGFLFGKTEGYYDEAQLGILSDMLILPMQITNCLRETICLKHYIKRI